MTTKHQPDQTDFRAILPEDVEWKPFPAFPPEARLAVLVGHPAEAGPYLVRVKVPGGTRLMPHKHPEDRIYTVLSASNITTRTTIRATRTHNSRSLWPAAAAQHVGGPGR